MIMKLFSRGLGESVTQEARRRCNRSFSHFKWIAYSLQRKHCKLQHVILYAGSYEGLTFRNVLLCGGEISPYAVITSDAILFGRWQ